MKIKNYVLIEAKRDGYSTDQIGSSMKVSQLIDFLENNFNRNDEIILSHDNGYTYGAITEGRIFEKTFEEDEYEEE